MEEIARQSRQINIKAPRRRNVVVPLKWAVIFLAVKSALLPCVKSKTFSFLLPACVKTLSRSFSALIPSTFLASLDASPDVTKRSLAGYYRYCFSLINFCSACFNSENTLKGNNASAAMFFTCVE